jgi:hypothetical protein
VPERDETRAFGFWHELLREESRLFPRLAAVFRFDAAVYAELESDANALPAAFGVVIATALAVGLGAPSFAGVFLGIAQALLYWGTVTAMVLGFAALVADTTPDYVVLLRCLGFAYAWQVVAVGGSLPLVGSLCWWAALALWAIALVQATRQVTRLPTEKAIAVCAGALLLPLVVFAAIV